MSEIKYGYEAHVSYCAQCEAHDLRVERIERCEVGKDLVFREYFKPDEGGEG